jgi:hypothetical protein
MLIIGLSLAMGGCGSKGPAVADVKGAVTLDGKPFTGASVRFFNASLPPVAILLNEDGTFETRNPIRSGSYRVSFDRPGGIVDSAGNTAFPKDQTSTLPDHYLSWEHSGLAAEVAENSKENVFTLQLSKKSKPPRGFRGNGKANGTPPPPPGIDNI